MRLLVIGGTVFLGHALVTDALDRGWEVTTFSRGRSGDPVPAAVALHGDRANASDLEQLRGQEWDAVVDTCGFVPAVVGLSTTLLAASVPRYAFISSISVYPDAMTTTVDESSRIFDTGPDATEGDYGDLKAGCERAVEESFPGKALHVRAGLLLGPRENIGRLPWWLNRIAQGGDVVAPGRPERPLQLIDVRDLAAWTLDAIDSGVTGPVNVVSRSGHTTTRALLESCVALTGSDARLVWVPEPALAAAEVAAWTELPCWVPEDDPEFAGFLSASAERAHETGLRCRPVEETVAGTWGWLAGGGVPVPRPGLPPVGLPADKEREVLAAVAT